MASQKSTEIFLPRPVNKETEACEEMLVNKEAETCRDMAEDFFRQKKLDFAICAIERARTKNPKLPGLHGYYVSYLVNKLAVNEKSWYAVLGLKNRPAAGIDEIKKRYDLLSYLLHPDKCSSVAAESASKLINEAWEVLSDARRREAYNILMGYNRGDDQSKNQTAEIENQFSSVGSGNSSPRESTSSNPHRTKKVLVIRRTKQRIRNKTLMDIIGRKPPVEVVKVGNDNPWEPLLDAKRKESSNHGDDQSKNQTSENPVLDQLKNQASENQFCSLSSRNPNPDVVEVAKQVIDLNFKCHSEERQP